MKPTFVSFKVAPTPWGVKPLPEHYDSDIEDKMKRWRWFEMTELVECLNRIIHDNPMHRLTTVNPQAVLINFGRIMSDRSTPQEKKSYTYLTSDGQGFFEVSDLPTHRTVLVPEGWGNSVMKFTERGVSRISFTGGTRKGMNLVAVFANNSPCRYVHRANGEWNWEIHPSPVMERVRA